MNDSGEGIDGLVHARIDKASERFTRIRVPRAQDAGIGEFFFLVHLTALQGTVYVPVSIASGKKPTGFIYQIEGTAPGSIVKTTISCSGDAVTQITVGTILYAKIPAGMTGIFRILVEMKGTVPHSYRIVTTTLNYKLDPSDARYKKLAMTLSSGILKFN